MLRIELDNVNHFIYVAINEGVKSMHTFMKVVSGSKLYGTNMESSDTDYKRIFIPSPRDIVLGKGETSNHVIDRETDDDTVSWSYHKWISLLLKMDSNAYEILFSPAHNLVEYSKNFMNFFPSPSKILSDNRDSAIGFVHSSMTKYALRGDRLEDFVELVSALSKYKTIGDSLEELKTIRNVKLYTDPMGVLMVSLHGKSYPTTGKLGECIRLFNKYVSSAGARSVNAVASHDWKGIAHGLRIASQMHELVKTGRIMFPLTNKDEVLAIRKGECSIDDACKMVEDKVQELKEEPASNYLLPKDSKEPYEYGMDLVARLYMKAVKDV